MANNFNLEVRTEGIWLAISSIPEKWFDKNDASFAVSQLTQDDLLDFKNKKLRLYRLHHDGVDIFGHEIAEFDVWAVTRNRLYALDPNKNFRHRMHKTRQD